MEWTSDDSFINNQVDRIHSGVRGNECVGNGEDNRDMGGGLFQVSRLGQTRVFVAEPRRALHLVTVLKRGSPTTTDQSHWPAYVLAGIDE